jgi:hypothetical protein
MLAGAVLAGAGHGSAFLGSQGELNHLAPPERRGELTAAFYVCIYLGVALPVIGVGVIALGASLATAVAVFAAVIGTSALLAAVWQVTALHEPI